MTASDWRLLQRGAMYATCVLITLLGCAAPRSAGPASEAFEWQPWNAATFALAARDRRPILVSVVAEWCHWCHVMDDETYGDPDVARLITERFVAVRVDSDARPDIAERYRAFGWPATAILTPDAQPVLERRGYQSPREFEDLLRGVADDVAAGRRVARRAPTPPRPVATDDLLNAGELAESRLDALYDAAAGGWGRQKYPVAAPIELLALRDHLDRTSSGNAVLTRTLAGWELLLDPVWGGMYQYSVRGDWEHPHFEKIAAVQAEGIDGFVRGYHATGDERLLRGARAIERYLAAFLTASDGRFITSQDADVGAHDPNAPRIDGHDYFPLDDAARRAIGVPWIDRHTYADRNGWIVAALARLHEATLDDTTLARATAAAERVATLHAAPGGGLRHAASDESPVLHLSDQVAMGRAFLALYESTGDATWKDRSVALAQFVERQMADAETGALFAHTPEPGAAGVFADRRRPFVQNARAARWYLRLHALTMDDVWHDRAERILRGIAADPLVRAAGRNVGDFAIAVRELDAPPVHIAVVGDPSDAATRALHVLALRAWHPHRVVEVTPPTGLYADLGHAAIYVCTAGACSSPLDADDVAAGKLDLLLAAAR